MRAKQTKPSLLLCAIRERHHECASVCRRRRRRRAVVCKLFDLLAGAIAVRPVHGRSFAFFFSTLFDFPQLGRTRSNA